METGNRPVYPLGAWCGPPQDCFVEDLLLEDVLSVQSKGPAVICPEAESVSIGRVGVGVHEERAFAVRDNREIVGPAS